MAHRARNLSKRQLEKISPCPRCKKKEWLYLEIGRYGGMKVVCGDCWWRCDGNWSRGAKRALRNWERHCAYQAKLRGENQDGDDK